MENALHLFQHFTELENTLGVKYIFLFNHHIVLEEWSFGFYYLKSRNTIGLDRRVPISNVTFTFGFTQSKHRRCVHCSTFKSLLASSGPPPAHGATDCSVVRPTELPPRFAPKKQLASEQKSCYNYYYNSANAMYCLGELFQARSTMRIAGYCMQI